MDASRSIVERSGTAEEPWPAGSSTGNHWEEGDEEKLGADG